MTDLTLDLTPDNSENAADLMRATCFVLEAHDEDRCLTPLGEAIAFSIHFGLPDRPDRLYAWTFFSLEDALKQMEALAQVYPQVDLWFRTAEIETQIDGGNVWESVVHAQAEIDEWDEDCHWVRVSRLIVRADNYGESLRRLLKEWVQGLDGEPDVPHEILCRV